MIKTEYPYNGKELIRTYSDEGFTIEQLETGNVYTEAIDVYPSKYTYVETNELNELNEEEENNVI